MPTTQPAPSFWHRRPVMIGGSVVFVVGFALVGSTFTKRQQEINSLRDLSDQLQEARIVADSCTRSLVQEESDFRRFSGRIDSLKSEVDTFEEMNDRGVPEELYEVYIETFDTYNDEVARWEGVADTLRSNETACRVTVERHNQLNDSLRGRMEAAGLTDTRPPGR